MTTIDHVNLSYDRAYALGDFATQLQQMSNVDEKLIKAFQDLTSIVDKDPISCLEKSNLVESGMLSCPHSEKGPSVSDYYREEDESEEAFDDAVEKL